MNIFNNLQQQYDQLWKYIIRPTRNTYPQKNLGPLVFQLEGKKVKRVDFQLINPRGYLIFCSHFVPLQEEKFPCVIYMHGNSSNRTQGMEYLGHLLRYNISLCTFDFSGCGNSEGDYVSLGYYEQQDLQAILSHIRNKPQVTNIAIWGRSMGAVTGLLYLRRSSKICAAVFDSPFKSLKNLIEDLVRKNAKIPSIIIAGALKIIAKTIQQKAKFDVYKLNPLKYQVPYLKHPAFFVVGIDDDLIPPEHTITLHEKYLGVEKHLEKVKGNHNDTRPEQCIDKIVNFLLKHLFQASVNYEQFKVAETTNSINQQEINFFDDDTQINNSSKQTENFDFFADDTSSKTSANQDFFNLKGQNTSNAANTLLTDTNFSFTTMFSNVFSGVTAKKQQKIKRGQDGYENTIQKIVKEISIQQTPFIKQAKQQSRISDQKKRNQIKQCKNQTFQKQIMLNLQSWGF